MAYSHPSLNNERSWPRRLLHVESFTSYEWQPGDKYGDTFHPTYNAITYTWGKFRTRSMTVESLPIAGVSWTSHLPRIKEDHFTANELKNIIQLAACPFPGYEKVEWVWIDVACIDQTPDLPGQPNLDKSSEIGRQAAIFRGAKDVFVWLTSHASEWIWEWANMFEAYFNRMYPGLTSVSAGDPLEWLSTMQAIFARFIQDPWFRSLWTLQEGFLRPDAIFLFRDGLPARMIEQCRTDDGTCQLFSLKSWIEGWHVVRSELRSKKWESNLQAANFDHVLYEIGLLEAVRDQQASAAVDDLEYPDGFVGNPFGLLVASSHRKPKREEDRIYGIMQVFDLQLGRSRPGATRHDFSLEELMDELGVELLRMYPIASHLVTQNTECPVGKAWRVSWTSSLPPEANRFWRHVAARGIVHCDTTRMDTKLVEGVLQGCFTGRVTGLKQWYQEVGFNTYNHLNLDLRWRTKTFERHGEKGTLRLVEEFPNVEILLLGRTSKAAADESLTVGHWAALVYEEWSIGLLLEPDGRPLSYRRIGTLIWEKRALKQQLSDFAYGIGQGWRIVTEGTFG